MSRADEIREQQQHQTWDRFSPGWMKWDALVMEMLAPVGAEILVARLGMRITEQSHAGSGGDLAASSHQL